MWSETRTSWSRVAEAADDLAQPAFGIADDVVHHADGEVADQPPAQRAHLGPESLQAVHQPEARLIDLRPLVGQAEPDPAAMAEPDAQPPLQLGDHGAEARQADVEDGLGRAEAAMLHHRREDPQQLQIDIVERGGGHSILS